MKAVVFNPVAVDDLDEITSYVAQDNLVAAEKSGKIFWAAPSAWDSIQPLASDLASVLHVSQAFDSFLQITFPLTLCSITNLKMKLKC